MSNLYFTYSLANSEGELEPTQFYLSTEFTIHYGNDDRGFTEKGTYAYPKSIKSATNKRKLVNQLIKELDQQRIERNKQARQRRQELRTDAQKARRVAKTPEVKEAKDYSKAELKLWALRTYFPRQYDLYKKGKLQTSQFRITSVNFIGEMVKVGVIKDFKKTRSRNTEAEASKIFQKYLFLNEEIPVTPTDNLRAEEQKSLLNRLGDSLIKDVINVKGIERYIFKLFTPQYDSAGNPIFAKENKYSFGYSLKRTTDLESEDELESHIYNTVEFYYGDGLLSAKNYLSRKFVSQITVSGMMLEKIVETR
jgi:hypothetical protein